MESNEESCEIFIIVLQGTNYNVCISEIFLCYEVIEFQVTSTVSTTNISVDQYFSYVRPPSRSEKSAATPCISEHLCITFPQSESPIASWVAYFTVAAICSVTSYIFGLVTEPKKRGKHRISPTCQRRVASFKVFYCVKAHGCSESLTRPNVPHDQSITSLGGSNWQLCS